MNKDKPKKRKIFTILITILAVLAIAATGIFLYVTPDNAAKARYRAEASVLAQEMTNKSLSRLDAAILENTYNDSSNQDESGQNGTAQDEPEQDGTEVTDKTFGTAGKIGTLSDAEKKELSVRLISIYDQIMLDMEDDAMALIDQLVAQAKVDYKKLKSEKNDNPASLGKLATEYMDRGNALEEQIDNSFQAVTDVMKEQMTGLGIDPEPVISNYQEKYVQVKEQRQKTLIDKALKAIKK